MKYKYKAIETLYKGIKFRSRLEATWAVFFDNLGWEWEYEPCDFNGWIPDFLLEGEYFVEVKPFSTKEQWLESEVPGDIERAGIEVGILCGISPVHREDNILAYRPKMKSLEEAGFYTGEEGEIFACNSMYDQSVRIGLKGRWKPYEEEISQKWVAAKNEVQWKKCN